MKKLTDIQGVIFDYGGTIDTNSRHWAEVLWEKYRELQVPVDKPVFREAYVHGERTLARQPLVKPEDNFYDVLRIKTRVQMDWLVENGILPREKAVAENYASRIADACYAYVLEVLKRTRPVVKTLSEHYKLVLVSNFYGNIQAVLKVKDMAMATSGNYRNFYYKNGKKYAHTIDPKTGRPVQHSLLSATVLAKDCATADAYATAFMVMGVEKAKLVLKNNTEIMAYFIYSDDSGKTKVWYSDTIRQKLAN